MTILTASGSLSLRPMTASNADLQQYLRWMQDPEVMRFWDGMTVQHTASSVFEKHRARLDDGVTPCFVLLAGSPIGYCQFYPTDAEAYDCPPAEYHRFLSPTDKVFGIELFLIPEHRDKGLGTRVITLLCAYLFRDQQADALLIDPKAHNARAIACYKKCGFRPLFTVPAREEQDGILHDSLIMGRFAVPDTCTQDEKSI